MEMMFLGGAPNGDDVFGEVHVLPLQSQQFAPPHSCEEKHRDRGAVLNGHTVQQFQQMPGLLSIQAFGFLLLRLGGGHPVTGVGNDHLPLDGGTHDGRDQPMIVEDGLGRQRLVVIGRVEEVFNGLSQCFRDPLCHSRVNILPLVYTGERRQGDPGFLSKFLFRHTFLLEVLLHVDPATELSVLVHLGQRVIELHQLYRANGFHAHMSDGGVDPYHQILIPCHGPRPELFFRIVSKPALGKVGKFDTAVYHHAGLYLFFKQCGLPFCLPIRLCLGHACRRTPGHVLGDLLALQLNHTRTAVSYPAVKPNEIERTLL